MNCENVVKIPCTVTHTSQTNFKMKVRVMYHPLILNRLELIGELNTIWYICLKAE